MRLIVLFWIRFFWKRQFSQQPYLFFARLVLEWWRNLVSFMQAKLFYWAREFFFLEKLKMLITKFASLKSYTKSAFYSFIMLLSFPRKIKKSNFPKKILVGTKKILPAKSLQNVFFIFIQYYFQIYAHIKKILCKFYTGKLILRQIGKCRF